MIVDGSFERLLCEIIMNWQQCKSTFYPDYHSRHRRALLGPEAHLNSYCAQFHASRATRRKSSMQLLILQSREGPT